MPRWVLWAIALIAALAAVALVIVLYRRRRTEAGTWTTGDFLVALGIALALFGGVISVLAAAGDDDGGEPADVAAFREDVRAACRALVANNEGSSIFTLVGTDGTIGRQALIDAMNAGLDAGIAILGTVWAMDVPNELADEVEDAHRTADVVLFIERSDVNEMATELPDPVPLQRALTYLQTKAGEHAAEATAFEAAMSQLAGEPCRPGVRP